MKLGMMQLGRRLGSFHLSLSPCIVVDTGAVNVFPSILIFLPLSQIFSRSIYIWIYLPSLFLSLSIRPLQFPQGTAPNNNISIDNNGDPTQNPSW
jgi:hypothetical protein